MVSQATLDAIAYAKDIDIEFNMKLLILGSIMLYSLFFLWWSFKLSNDKGWVVLCKYLFMRGLTIPYIAFFPFALMMMYRQISLEGILSIMLLYYNILFFVGMVIFFFFGMEWILGFLGIKDLGKILTNKIGKTNVFKRK